MVLLINSFALPVSIHHILTMDWPSPVARLSNRCQRPEITLPTLLHHTLPISFTSPRDFYVSLSCWARFHTVSLFVPLSHSTAEEASRLPASVTLYCGFGYAEHNPLGVSTTYFIWHLP